MQNSLTAVKQAKVTAGWCCVQVTSRCSAVMWFSFVLLWVCKITLPVYTQYENVKTQIKEKYCWCSQSRRWRHKDLSDVTETLAGVGGEVTAWRKMSHAGSTSVATETLLVFVERKGAQTKQWHTGGSVNLWGREFYQGGRTREERRMGKDSERKPQSAANASLLRFPTWRPTGPTENLWAGLSSTQKSIRSRGVWEIPKEWAGTAQW